LKQFEFLNIFSPTAATHLNNGPVEPPLSTLQQQQQAVPREQPQLPPITITATNKRSAPANANPVNTIQVPTPIENGLDYRGHHPSVVNANQVPSSSASATLQSTTIRFFSFMR